MTQVMVTNVILLAVAVIVTALAIAVAVAILAAMYQKVRKWLKRPVRGG